MRNQFLPYYVYSVVDINEELKEKMQVTQDTVEGLREELQKPCDGNFNRDVFCIPGHTLQ